jgi:hypothetical protein
LAVVIEDIPPTFAEEEAPHGAFFGMRLDEKKWGIFMAE